MSNFHADSVLVFQHESTRTYQRDEHEIQGVGRDRSTTVVDNPQESEGSRIVQWCFLHAV